MTMTRATLSAIALGIVCLCSSVAQPAVLPESTIRKIFQAELPSSVTNLRIWSGSLFTMVVYGKFECATDDLKKFLKASALLPDKLEKGINPLEKIQVNTSDLPWWQPVSLQNVSGVECAWDNGKDVASCHFVAGHNEHREVTTVYFMVVYEDKDATGLRPDVKANPNWKLETKKNSHQRIDSNH